MNMENFVRKWLSPKSAESGACLAGVRLIQKLEPSMLLDDEELVADLPGTDPWITLISGTTDDGKPKRLYLNIHRNCAVSLRLSLLLTGEDVDNDQLIVLQAWNHLPETRQHFRTIIFLAADTVSAKDPKSVHWDAFNSVLAMDEQGIQNPAIPVSSPKGEDG